MDAPKRIWLQHDPDDEMDGDNALVFAGEDIFHLTEHERVVAEMEAQHDLAFDLTERAQAAAIRAQERWAEARNKALEEAAQMLLRTFRSMGLIEDFAAVIRAMTGEWPLTSRAPSRDRSGACRARPQAA